MDRPPAITASLIWPIILISSGACTTVDLVLSQQFLSLHQYNLNCQIFANEKLAHSRYKIFGFSNQGYRFFYLCIRSKW